MVEISPQDVQQNRASLTLLDCREHKETAICRIDGAVHIPMGEIPTRLSELNRESDLVVYCHHGVRSMNTALFLRKQGFTRVRSMAGGIDAWAAQVEPSMPRY